MALKYGFYNSSEDKPRTYDAEDMSGIFDGIISDGVFDSFGDSFKVMPGTGLSVIVKSGRAWFKHTWTYNSSDLELIGIESYSDALNYYGVVLQVDTRSDYRENKILLKQNTSSSFDPSNPGTILDNEMTNKFEYLLALVAVPPNASSIPIGGITSYVGTDLCPWAGTVIEKSALSKRVSDIEDQLSGGIGYTLGDVKRTIDVISNNEAWAELGTDIDSSQHEEFLELITKRFGWPSYFPIRTEASEAKYIIKANGIYYGFNYYGGAGSQDTKIINSNGVTFSSPVIHRSEADGTAGELLFDETNNVVYCICAEKENPSLLSVYYSYDGNTFSKISTVTGLSYDRYAYFQDQYRIEIVNGILLIKKSTNASTNKWRNAQVYCIRKNGSSFNFYELTNLSNISSNLTLSDGAAYYNNKYYFTGHNGSNLLLISTGNINSGTPNWTNSSIVYNGAAIPYYYNSNDYPVAGKMCFYKGSFYYISTYFGIYKITDGNVELLYNGSLASNEIPNTYDILFITDDLVYFYTSYVAGASSTVYNNVCSYNIKESKVIDTASTIGLYHRANINHGHVHMLSKDYIVNCTSSSIDLTQIRLLQSINEVNPIIKNYMKVK